MKKSFSSFIKITFAALFSLTLASCSDIFNSRNGTLSISLPSARTGSFLPDMEPEVYLYDFEVRNNAGIIIYKSEELTPEDNLSISDIEPGRYSVVIKAYTVDGNLKYANYSREKFVNVKAGTPTAVTVKLHETPDFTLHYNGTEDGYEIMGNIDPSHFGISDNKKQLNYPYTSWENSYTLSCSEKAFGVVPVTITSNDFDFLTSTVNVTVKYSLEGIVPVTLKGTGGTKENGSTFSFSVEPVKPSSDYIWYKTSNIEGEIYVFPPVNTSLYQVNKNFETLGYQWYDNDKIIDGASEKTLTVTNAQSGEHNYHCVVSMQATDPEYCIEREKYDYSTDSISVTVKEPEVFEVGSVIVDGNCYTGYVVKYYGDNRYLIIDPFALNDNSALSYTDAQNKLAYMKTQDYADEIYYEAPMSDEWHIPTKEEAECIQEVYADLKDIFSTKINGISIGDPFGNNYFWTSTTTSDGKQITFQATKDKAFGEEYPYSNCYARIVREITYPFN